jgi:protein-disulfide isomerase
MTKEILVVAVSFALTVSACAGSGDAARRPAAGAPAAADAPSQVLGKLDGVAITRTELSDGVKERLDEIDNEAEQRKFHMTWAGVEEVIAERLLAQEAKKRNVAVDALRDAEIAGKIATPTDDDLHAFYDANLTQTGIPFDIAAPQIRNELVKERLATQERAFVDELRGSAKIEYSIPAPALPRSSLQIGVGPSVGPQDAKVTLVEFSDFQCPYCARASGIIHKLRELYPNDLRVEFRDFPLQQHPRAETAAAAAHCASEQNKFWEFHDLLFANPSALDTSDLRRYAEQVKLDLAAFDTCLGSGRPTEAVHASQAVGHRLGIEGTPAIYINGIKLIGLLPLPLMQSIIDRELGK